MALCATTALAGAVPRLCVRGARGRFGGFGPVPGVVSLSFSPSRPACSALRVPGRPVRLSLTLARWYAIPRGLCVPRARSGCPSGSPRVPFTWVCARAPAASAPPPWVVWRAHLAWSQHWALVGPFQVVRAPPRVLPRSLAPSGLLGGGGVRSRFPPTWLGVLGVVVGRPRGGWLLLLRGASGVRRSPSPDCPPTGRLLGSAIQVLWARAWGPFSVPSACTPCGGCAPRGGSVAFVCRGAGWGGGGRAPYPPFVRPGGGCRAGGRSASFRPSAFPWAGNKAGVTGVVLSMGGVAPHTTPVRAHPPSLGAICPGALARARLFSAAPVGAGSWGGGAGHALAPLSGGGGTIPPASGGGGLGGGGVAPRPPCSPSRWRPAVLNPGPPRVVGALPSGVRVRSGSQCRPGVGGG